MQFKMFSEEYLVVRWIINFLGKPMGIVLYGYVSNRYSGAVDRNRVARRQRRLLAVPAPERPPSNTDRLIICSHLLTSEYYYIIYYVLNETTEDSHMLILWQKCVYL